MKQTGITAIDCLSISLRFSQSIRIVLWISVVLVACAFLRPKSSSAEPLIGNECGGETWSYGPITECVDLQSLQSFKQAKRFLFKRKEQMRNACEKNAEEFRCSDERCELAGGAGCRVRTELVSGGRYTDKEENLECKSKRAQEKTLWLHLASCTTWEELWETLYRQKLSTVIAEAKAYCGEHCAPVIEYRGMEEGEGFSYCQVFQGVQGAVEFRYTIRCGGEGGHGDQDMKICMHALTNSEKECRATTLDAAMCKDCSGGCEADPCKYCEYYINPHLPLFKHAPNLSYRRNAIIVLNGDEHECGDDFVPWFGTATVFDGELEREVFDSFSGWETSEPRDAGRGLYHAKVWRECHDNNNSVLNSLFMGRLILAAPIEQTPRLRDISHETEIVCALGGSSYGCEIPYLVKLRCDAQKLVTKCWWDSNGDGIRDGISGELVIEEFQINLDAMAECPAQ